MADETTVIIPPEEHFQFGFDDDGWDDTLAEINMAMGPEEDIRPAFAHKILTYEDVNIEFPYEPYESQKQMMQKIIEGVTKGKNCLLESPTGTGKTAALLCALLAWQKDCYLRGDNCSKVMEKIAEQIGGCTCGLIKDRDNTKVTMSREHGNWFLIATYRNPSTSESVSIEDTTTNSPTTSCNTSPVKAPTTPVTPNKLHQTSLASSPYLRSPTKAKLYLAQSNLENSESPSKRQKLLGTEEVEVVKVKNVTDVCSYCKKMYVYDRVRPPKIYYCTRTHSQIAQVVKQLKSTAYGARTRMTILASRGPYCISKEAQQEVLKPKSLEQSQTQGPAIEDININDVCSRWTKNYYALERMKESLSPAKFQEEMCKEGMPPPVCKFYSKLGELRSRFTNLFAGGAWDFEDAKDHGKFMTACPYYSSATLHADADIVFGSYNYLIEPSLREFKGIKYVNSVLVFDEAHNIEDICRSAYSLTIDLNDFEKRLLDPVEYLLEKYEADPNNHEINPGIKKGLDKLLKTFENCRLWMTKQGEKIRLSRTRIDDAGVIPFENEQLTEAVKEMGMDVKSINECLELLAYLSYSDPEDDDYIEDEGSQGSQSVSVDVKPEGGRNYYKDSRGNQHPFKFPSSVKKYLETIKMPLVYLCKTQNVDGTGSMKDFKGFLTKKRIRITTSNTNTPNRRSLKKREPKEFHYIFQIICLNPAIAFRELRDSAYSIIVASGTLTPLNSFASELATNFEVTLQADHVIKQSQVFAGVVSIGPTHHELKLVKNQQDDAAIQDEIGNVIYQICNCVPNGVLVFLPSYTFLNKLKSRWSQYPTSETVFDQIKKKKLIFFEESADKKLFKESMEKYKTEVVGGPTHDGCILFAVFRGKVSEGIDFADEQARVVITIGIPFANWKAADVESKMLYNEMRKSSESEFLSGSEWYETQAFRAMNQGFGRCVRHSNDWGAIIMIESRMNDYQKQKYVSGWVRKFIKSYTTFEELELGLKKFVSARTQQDNFRKQRAKLRKVVRIGYETESGPLSMNPPGPLSMNPPNGSNELFHELPTQRIELEQLTPPTATSSPVRQTCVVESSPEYSFDEEIDEIMGSQPQPLEPLHTSHEIAENVVQRGEGQAENDSDVSVFERSLLSPQDFDTNDESDEEMCVLADQLQRNHDLSIQSIDMALEQNGLDNSEMFDISMRSVGDSSQVSQCNSVSYHSSDLET